MGVALAVDPASALDCSVSRIVTCSAGGCAVARSEDDRVSISLDVRKSTIEVSEGEGSRSGKERIVSSRDALAVAVSLGPVRQGARSLGGSGEILSMFVDKKAGGAFTASRGGREILTGTCG